MQELLREALCARVLLVWDGEAETVCERNGMSVRDMLAPFCRVDKERVVRSVGEHSLKLKALKVRFVTLTELKCVGQSHHNEASSLSRLIAAHCPWPQQHDNDADAKSQNDDEKSMKKKSSKKGGRKKVSKLRNGGGDDVAIADDKHEELQMYGDLIGFAQRYSAAPLRGKEELRRFLDETLRRGEEVTPWYCRYREEFVRSLGVSDHEFIEHPVACVCVLSASNPNPSATVKRLYNAKAAPIVFREAHMHTDLPMFVVMLHDPTRDDRKLAEERLQALKSQFGASCKLLRVNSREQPGEWPEPFARYFDLAQRGLVAQLDGAGGAAALAKRGQCWLAPDDCARIDATVASVALSCVLPQLERTVGALHEHVSTVRKSTTGFRSWWGRFRSGRDGDQQQLASQSSPAIAQSVHGEQRRHGTSTGGGGGDDDDDDDDDRRAAAVAALAVGRPSPSSSAAAGAQGAGDASSMAGSLIGHDMSRVSLTRQTKELADLLMIIGDYENALATYKLCAPEFKSEREWRYYGGSLEMMGLCAYMLDPNRHRDADSELDKAIAYYCKPGDLSLPFATRATFFLSAILRLRGQYREAADALTRIAKACRGSMPLRTALFQEQAAFCYLLTPRMPMFRRWSFQLVVAAGYFEQAGHARHAVGCYAAANAVYDRRNWTRIEDHIRYLMARQLFALGNVRAACRQLKFLLRRENTLSPQRQNSHLRETLSMMLTLAADGGVGEIDLPLPRCPVPLIRSSSISVFLNSSHAAASDDGASSSSSSSSSAITTSAADEGRWQAMRAMLVDEQQHVDQSQRRQINTFSYLYKFGKWDRSLRNASPVSVVQEYVHVDVELHNPLHVPLQFEAMQLLCEHSDAIAEEETSSGSASSSSSSSVASAPVSTQGRPFLIADERCVLVKPIDVLLGAREVKRVRFSVVPLREGQLRIHAIGFLLANTVWARRQFELPPIRLNRTNEQRHGRLHEPDRSLTLTVCPPMPLIDVRLAKFPNFLLFGELRRIVVTVTNHGKLALRNVKVLVSHPHFMTFGEPRELDADFPPPPPPATAASEHSESASAFSSSVSQLASFAFSRADCRRRFQLGIVHLDDIVGTLAPGASTQAPLWVRGHAIGSHQFQMLFYYEPDAPSVYMPHRVHRVEEQMRVLPAIQLDALTRASLSTVDSYVLSLQVQNHQANAVFQLEQLTCMSRRWTLVPLSQRCGQAISPQDPLASGDLRTLGPRQSTTLFFRLSPFADDSRRSDDDSDDSTLSICATNLSFRRSTRIETLSSPFLHFVTNDYFVQHEALIMNEQASDGSDESSRSLGDAAVNVIDQSLGKDHVQLSLFWRTANGAHFGQFNIANVSFLPSHESGDGGPARCPLRFNVDVPRRVVHDFERDGPICTVPVAFHVLNAASSSGPITFSFETLKPSDAKDVPYSSLADTRCQFFWAGTTRHSVAKLEPDQHDIIHTSVCFTEHGVYSINRFRFVVVAPDRPPQHVYSPLQHLVEICQE
jgi:trafficking protein particle complex subunit 8